MLAEISVDQRFDKPAVHSLVDLINRKNALNLAHDNVELVSVRPYDGPDFTVQDLVDRATFATTAEIRLLSNPEQVLDISYLRLLLPAYLYQSVIVPENLTVPAVLTDHYVTTVDTAVVDALAYLDSEYHVQLTLDDCTVISDPEALQLDGSWPVVITPNETHPIWLGSVTLNAQTA